MRSLVLPCTAQNNCQSGVAGGAGTSTELLAQQLAPACPGAQETKPVSGGANRKGDRRDKPEPIQQEKLGDHGGAGDVEEYDQRGNHLHRKEREEDRERGKASLGIHAPSIPGWLTIPSRSRRSAAIGTERFSHRRQNPYNGFRNRFVCHLAPPGQSVLHYEGRFHGVC